MVIIVNCLGSLTANWHMVISVVMQHLCVYAVPGEKASGIVLVVPLPLSRQGTKFWTCTSWAQIGPLCLAVVCRSDSINLNHSKSIV